MQHSSFSVSVILKIISIHAPYKGCNVKPVIVNRCPWLFQSMHPIKDATKKRWKKLAHYLFQSMHPIKDATNKNGIHTLDDLISIHAPYKGCNYSYLGWKDIADRISIHAPYKGCNVTGIDAEVEMENFNPCTL